MLIMQELELKEVERATSNMVRGQSWRALSGVAGLATGDFGSGRRNQTSVGRCPFRYLKS